MKHTIITIAALFTSWGSALAQEAVSEPPELQTRRLEHLKAMQRASVPVLTSHVRQLEAMKSQFTRQGNLNGALAVDKELKRAKAELDAANATAQGAVGAVSLPLKVISAIYSGPAAGGDRRDFGARVQGVLESGAAKMTMLDVAGAYDPAPFKKKTLTIEYSINGKVKKKVYQEGATVNFREDLK
jgi:hypothetical protein